MVELKVEVASGVMELLWPALSFLPWDFFLPKKNKPLSCLHFFLCFPSFLPCVFKLLTLTLWLNIWSNCHLLDFCFWPRWNKKELIQLKSGRKYMKQQFSRPYASWPTLILVYYLCKVIAIAIQGKQRLFCNTWKLLHKCSEQKARSRCSDRVSVD